MSTIEKLPQLCSQRLYDVQVTDEDGPPRVVSYLLRGLDNDEEITAWTLFCEEAFSYKKPSPPTRDYFARHYYNDPDKKPSHVRVVIANPESSYQKPRIYMQDIVASCRIFHRTISLIGIPKDSTEATDLSAAAGGIGEVCTRESHRCRGLAKELLNDALVCMKEMQMYVSLLHSAPSFFPVYQKLGYVNVTSHWSVITINRSNLLRTVTMQYNKASDESLIDQVGLSLRLANFPSDTAQLRKLHRYYSEERFMGCIVRSTEYWNVYISAELGDKLWILEETSVFPGAVDVENVGPTNILGWMALRYRQHQQRYQLCEFGCHDIRAAPSIFHNLLVHCHKTMESPCSNQKNMIDDSKLDCWRLHLPTSILREVSGNNEGNYISDTISENDDGWMYKPLTEKPLNMASWVGQHEHLIWPSDSF